MKSMITTITFILLISHKTLANDNNCNQYDKLISYQQRVDSLTSKRNTQ